MSTVRFHVGDVFEVMRTMPDQSVDLIVTSPPFLALRSYLPADHPDKAKEIGSEPTPAAFLDTLLELSAECRRLLTPTGSLCVELGDTYSGSGGGGGDYLPGGLREDQPGFGGSAERQREGNAAHWRQKNEWKKHEGDGRRNRPADVAAGILAPTKRPGPEGRDRMPGWPLAKSLCGIPAAYELSLIYGHNVISGAPSPAGRWRVRNWMPWTRPNPPVGALGDKFRPATSFVTVACVSDRRWFDLDAVRGGGSPNTHARLAGVESHPVNGKKADNPNNNYGSMAEVETNGAPPLDWHDDTDQTEAWQPLHRMPTAPYPGAHYATYPLALPRKLIEAMCPRSVCVVCGEARRRITEPNLVKLSGSRGVKADALGNTTTMERTESRPITLGWTDCDCGADLPTVYHDSHHRPGIVLDPFAGSGTTLLAAALCGRDAIGIDLDATNLDLTLERLNKAALVAGDNPYTVNPDLPPAVDNSGTPSLFSEAL